jgi:hypothetical protein
VTENILISARLELSVSKNYGEKSAQQIVVDISFSLMLILLLSGFPFKYISHTQQERSLE